jgi:hypothetical protein
MDHTSWFLSSPLSRTIRNFGRLYYFFSSSPTLLESSSSHGKISLHDLLMIL